MSDKKLTPMGELFKSFGHLLPDVQDKYLTAEREAMIDAYYAGTIQFANEAEIVKPMTPEDYISITYKTP